MGSGYSGRDRYGGETTCDVRVLSISTGTRVRVRAAGNTKKRNGKAGNGAEAGEKGGGRRKAQVLEDLCTYSAVFGHWLRTCFDK